MLFLATFSPPVPPVKVLFQEFPLGEADWWIAGATLVLALVTGILAFYTYLLYRAAVEARKDSLQALTISEQASQRTLHAYVAIDGPKVLNTAGHGIPLATEVTVRNTGQTHAIQTNLTFTRAIGRSIDMEITNHPMRTVIAIGVLGNNQTRAVIRDGRPSPTELEDIMRKTGVRSSYLIFGEVHYWDMFSKEERLTTFAFEWNRVRRQFNAMPGLNDVT